MLSYLNLRDFVLVEEAQIDFGAGFTVLTGETGAGKSILLDALALATGARAQADVVRHGAARAEITAAFDVDAPLQAWLAERDLQGDDDAVLLRRVIEADGRSRAYVNGRPATAAILRELGDRMVDVHGQHAAQSLLRADGQRMLVDSCGGLDPMLESVEAAWTQWRAAGTALQAAESGARELAAEREGLEAQIERLDTLAPAEGEWETLNDEQRMLANAASLLSGSEGLARALKDDDDALASRLHAAMQALRPLAGVDARLAEPLSLLETAAIQVDEAASALSSYASRAELDPARLAQVEERVGALFDAARRLRVQPGELPARWAELQQRLAQLQASQDIEALRAREAATRAVYEKAADELSAARKAAAERLADGVSTHLAELGMGGTRLAIDVQPRAPGPSGIDAVEFGVAVRGVPGTRPLARVASGGELSRVGLAISVVAAQANPVSTLVFDEADAGVGGAVADAIGLLMRRLGEDRQVLCVTHLPQVASKAHAQLRVEKASGGDDQPVTTITPLAAGDRVEEIARMLGGAQITATTRRHAREMIAGASDRHPGSS